MALSPEDIKSALSIAGQIVGLASVVAAALPHPPAGANVAIKILRGILDVLAANLGNAANAGTQPVGAVTPAEPAVKQEQDQ